MKLTVLTGVVAILVAAGGCSAFGGTKRVPIAWSKAQVISHRTIVRVLILDDPADIRVDAASFETRGRHPILLSLFAHSWVSTSLPRFQEGPGYAADLPVRAL